MDKEIIVEIIRLLGYLILGGFALYFNTQKTLKYKVTEFITEAEEQYKDTTKAGGIKFEYVIDKLYGIIPKVIKPFIPRSVVENIVKVAFEKIESYAKLQLDKIMEISKTENGD